MMVEGGELATSERGEKALSEVKKQVKPFLEYRRTREVDACNCGGTIYDSAVVALLYA